MSRLANSSAIKRRTVPANMMSSPILQSPQSFQNTLHGREQPSNSLPNPQQNAATGLTLQQVISIIDTRLTKLEQAKPAVDVSYVQDISIVEEFNSRFEILAEEITNLKNVVLSLQAYTMEINKTLVDERVRVFSDLSITTPGFEPSDVPVNIQSEIVEIEGVAENSDVSDNLIV